MKIIVDRLKWCRGESYKSSRLLRESDGKSCCLGFALNQCGIPWEELNEQESPETVISFSNNSNLRWLLSNDNNSTAAYDLMKTNDLLSISEERREENIKSVFVANGDEIEFIN